MAANVCSHAIRTYQLIFGWDPKRDIAHISGPDISDFDMLCAGFPCQHFGIIGNRRGFGDTRRTLFFDIARIIQAEEPKFAANFHTPFI
jgi:DNA (cytosine-5)-methyltransferase 1